LADVVAERLEDQISWYADDTRHSADARDDGDRGTGDNLGVPQPLEARWFRAAARAPVRGTAEDRPAAYGCPRHRPRRRPAPSRSRWGEYRPC